MTASDLVTARAWVDVDLGALVANYRSLLERANPRVGALPVVKADAYGVGIGPVLRALETLRPWGYAVAALGEGLEVRRHGVERPVVLLFNTPEELAAAAEAGVTPVIGDGPALRRWREMAGMLGRKLPFHLEIDTGMGRSGFPHDAVDSWLPEALEAASDGLIWEGTLTHFHSSEVEDETPSREQWERWERCVRRFPAGTGGLHHISATAAALRFPEYGADLIRPGIHLYGAPVSPGLPWPRPVAVVRARVTSVRDVPAGSTSSYGATYTAPASSRWATLAIGYGDGLRRELSNRGCVTFDGKTAPIVGRVCMDVTVVDVTRLEGVGPGSVATVIGGPHGGPTAFDSVAAACGTIPYEILTGLTGRLPRRYVGPEGTAHAGGSGDSGGAT